MYKEEGRRWMITEFIFFLGNHQCDDFTRELAILFCCPSGVRARGSDLEIFSIWV